MEKFREVLNDIARQIEYGKGATEPELKHLWNKLSWAITDYENTIEIKQPEATKENIQVIEKWIKERDTQVFPVGLRCAECGSSNISINLSDVTTCYSCGHSNNK